ncbi:nuclear transport factor 2 family protein [Fulvivirga ulvae]|uniref:nuclear transport factor 2 family protein n=1 Tax=Fulvivirga ulvae TaxID=2904245 RepID=UPI001F2195FB|nr:nuclear transport factor 2 family protein [Fulvivirga ulvae]UII31907.1 nuclear transport factor 2 family protein [Fulvivirga ulvae]
MKTCKTNLTSCKTGAIPITRILPLFSIIMATMLLILTGCEGLESDLNVDSSKVSTENSSNPMTNLEESRPVSEKCLTIGQEITDRNNVYEAAFIAKDVDLMYNYLWTPTYFQLGHYYDADRDKLLEEITQLFTVREGGLYSLDLESYDRFVHDNVVYDIGAYDNTGVASGVEFAIKGYYLMRWEKGSDGIWRVDRVVAGDREPEVEISRTTDSGPVLCQKKRGNLESKDETSKEITKRQEAYLEALISSNAYNAYKFYTKDFRNVSPGLEVDRDGLDEYYRQLFATGEIVSYNINLYDRFVHGNVVYDMGKSELTTVINGVQSMIRYNYAVRWEKGHDGEWRIDRILNTPPVN